MQCPYCMCADERGRERVLSLPASPVLPKSLPQLLICTLKTPLSWILIPFIYVRSL